jgi:hypothetical protein
MEPRYRELFEKYLDEQLQEERLLMLYEYWRKRYDEGIIENVKSAMMGELKGCILAIYITLRTMSGRSTPSLSEINEFHKMFNHRYPEIQSKIRKIIEAN